MFVFIYWFHLFMDIFLPILKGLSKTFFSQSYELFEKYAARQWGITAVARVQIDLDCVLVFVRGKVKINLDGVARGRIGGCFVVFLVFINEVNILISRASTGKKHKKDGNYRSLTR